MEKSKPLWIKKCINDLLENSFACFTPNTANSVSIISQHMNEPTEGDLEVVYLKMTPCISLFEKTNARDVQVYTITSWAG